MTAEQLATALAAIPAVNLEALELYREFQPPPGAWIPQQVPTARIVSATLQLMDYQTASRELAKRLKPIQPQPLTAIIPEYGL